MPQLRDRIIMFRLLAASFPVDVRHAFDVNIRTTLRRGHDADDFIIIINAGHAVFHSPLGQRVPRDFHDADQKVPSAANDGKITYQPAIRRFCR